MQTTPLKGVALRNRCYQVALENTPSNVRYIHLLDKRPIGYVARAHMREGWLEVTRPNTPTRLWAFLHECYHMKSGCFRPQDWGVVEYECEKFAHDVMVSAGLATERLIEDSKRCVWYEAIGAIYSGRSHHYFRDAFEYVTGDPDWYNKWVEQSERLERRTQKGPAV